MKVGNSSRLELDRPFVATAGAGAQAVADKVEVELKYFVADWDRRRAKPACGNVKWDLPAVVDPGGQRQPDLAHDLGPELQGCGCVTPDRIRQIGPNSGVVHGSPPVKRRRAKTNEYGLSYTAR